MKKGQTREIKALRAPLPSTFTRETHPAYFYDRERNGIRPTKWRGTGNGHPCSSCDRLLTDSYSQALICHGRHMGKAYVLCRVCGVGETLEIEKRTR